MAEIKAGWQTSEFRFGALIGTLTTFGEQLGIFDVSSFESDPVLMLVYRSVQLVSLALVAVYYINGRSEIKKNGQIPAPVILEKKES